jgi:ADP-heptose:LPS heptosyltransferase
MGKTKILLVQLFSNGDCLYATAVARQIKKDFDNCQLTWAISSSCKNIIANNPFVDDILEVATVPKDDEAAFRTFVKSVKDSGSWDKIIITHLIGENLAHYDGCIRSALLRGYKYPLTVNVQPVLRLSDAEGEKVRIFAEEHQLSSYRNVILFEFAPLSGQALITFEQALSMAERLADRDTAIILSSARRVAHDNRSIIDGSVLSVRETAALTHFCTFLIGCSSGITWITTSDAAKPLPMVQLLNPNTNMINPISRDFQRFGIDDSKLIELLHTDPGMVVQCVEAAMVDFEKAKINFHQQVPLHFKSTRNIVYNLLCYMHFKAILTHIRINREVFGDRLPFYANLFMGFAIFPFRLVGNFFRKKVFR